MRFTTRAALLAVLAIPSSSTLATSEVSLQVRPAIGVAPADVIVTVRVEEHADNRFVIVEAESDTSYRSSLEQLDGAASSRVHVFRWRGMPEGQYVVRTTLVRANGVRRVAQSRMHIVSTRG